MSMKIPKDLLSYVDTVETKHSISKEIIIDILENLPKIDADEYEPAFVVEKKLGLSSRFFSRAYRNQTEIKAHFTKHYEHIYVNLDADIKSLLKDGYICMKITPGVAREYDKAIYLTKNTLLGFYK